MAMMTTIYTKKDSLSNFVQYFKMEAIETIWKNKKQPFMREWLLAD
jgi:hypothetical protein